MEAQQALAELTEISSQIEAACMFDAAGEVIASTFATADETDRFVDAARSLLSAGDGVPRDATLGPLVQLEAVTHGGSVFVVRDDEQAIAATTKPEPTVGLVFYDLKSCLRSVAAGDGGDGKPRPRTRRKEDGESAA
jgi:predicted regulator of Ras-like GTPase activity (Roadblock/LC7/MglB family)